MDELKYCYQWQVCLVLLHTILVCCSVVIKCHDHGPNNELLSWVHPSA